MKVSVSQTISVPFSVTVSNIYLSFNKKFRSYVPLEFLSKNHIEVLILSIVVTLITYQTQSLHSVHGLLLTHAHCFEFVSLPAFSQVMRHITALVLRPRLAVLGGVSASTGGLLLVRHRLRFSADSSIAVSSSSRVDDLTAEQVIQHLLNRQWLGH